MGYLYKLTNKVNGKSYIGQTIRSIQSRLEEHQKEDSGCVAIRNAIQYYGWDNFEKEWYEVPNEDLNFYEEMLVALLDTLAPDGYNLKEGGSNGKLSEETKQKISESQRGEKNPMFGKTQSEETKQKQRDAQQGEKNHMFGETHTEETKQKISESMIGEKHHSSKRVYQYDLDGNYIGWFGSGGEAARALGKISWSNINDCANRKRKTAYGFKWSFELHH
jgi:group I intron endonuclease